MQPSSNPAQVLVQAGKTGLPFSISAQIAALGFSQRGFEVATVNIQDQTFDRNTIVIASATVIEKVLAKLDIRLPGEDYPESLRAYLGRSIGSDTLGKVLIETERWPIFIKPKEQKLFAGSLLRAEEDLRNFRSMALSTPVWTSTPLALETEYRIYVLQGQIVSVARYTGPWQNYPDASRVDEMIAAFQAAPNCPQAYCLDVGITSEGNTILIEATEILGASNYGLAPYLHSQMIEVRWRELTGGIIPEFCYPVTPPHLNR